MTYAWPRGGATPGRRGRPGVAVGAAGSVVDDEAVALVLEPHQLRDRRRDEQDTGDEMRAQVLGDAVRREIVGVDASGDRLTGVSVRGVVSGEEQHPPPHE